MDSIADKKLLANEPSLLITWRGVVEISAVSLRTPFVPFDYMSVKRLPRIALCIGAIQSQSGTATLISGVIRPTDTSRGDFRGLMTATNLGTVILNAYRGYTSGRPRPVGYALIRYTAS